MDTIKRITDMLAEEKKNNLKLQEQYRKEIFNLPKGSIIKRELGANEWFQLSYYCKETKKSVLKYIGKDKALVSVIKEKIEKRKNLEKMLKALEKDLETIEKMLKPANQRLQQGSISEKLKKVKVEEYTSKKLLSQISSMDIKK